MKVRSIAVLGLNGVLIFSACSSSETEDAKVQKASLANNVNVANTAAERVSANSPAADANAVQTVAAADDNLASPNALQRKKEAMTKTGGEAAPVDFDKLATQNLRPAPENSTFTSYLADAGYEIRAFKKHPKLLKVEKKISSDGKQFVKVFLRDGRVIEVPGESVAPLSTMSSVAILDIVADHTQPGGPGSKKPGTE